MESSNTKRQFVASSNRIPNHLHIVLIATGSVASVKIPLIVDSLLKYKNVQIQVVATKPSLAFFDAQKLSQETNVQVWTDEDEWSTWKKIPDPILHIELRRWADLVLIAPCSANTLGKLAAGLCDNLATSLLRALPPMLTPSKPLVAGVPVWVFPAMNTMMYEHPLTANHLQIVTEVLKYEVHGPIGKGLACGDVGVGAMMEWREIVGLVVGKYELVSL